jgi:hypothetical protein
MAAIVAALRLREAEERRRVIQRIADNFTPSPPGVCAHCGEGARVADPFVLLFANDDRADIHSSCHSAWWAKRFGNGAWVAKKLQGVRSVTSAAMAGLAHESTPSPWAEIQKNATESMTLLASKNRADSSNGDNTADSSDGSSRDDNTADSNGGSNKDDNMVDSNGGSKGGSSSADNNSRPFGCRLSRRAARAKAMRA